MPITKKLSSKIKAKVKVQEIHYLVYHVNPV